MTTTPKLWKSLTQVNATDGGTEQIDGQIAGLHDGGYFVVWTDSNSHAHSAFAAIMGQRYDATGNKVGGEVHVSTGFVGPGFPASVSSPAATVLPNGNIAVAFEYIVEESGGGLINDRNIYVRIFDPALNILRTDTIATGTNQTFHPSITAFGDGSYVVSYTVGVGDAPSVIADTDIVARIVSPTGVVGSQFDIDNQDDNRDNSQLATLSNGNFVVVYQDEFAGSPTDTDILYQVRAPNGSPVTGGVVPGGDGSGPEFDPHLAALRDGGFVVVWTDQIGASVSDMRATIFSDAGDPLPPSDPNAASIRVNTTLADLQDHSSVVALADGGFLVSWENHDLGLVRGQRFSAIGDKIGAEFTMQNGATDAGPEATLLTDGRIGFAVGHLSGDADVMTSIWTTGLADRHVHDFNDDGKSDILFRNDNGAVGLWELNGGQVIATASLGTAGPAWHIADTGDFNGDAKSDILWHNDNGAVGIWELNGGSVIAAVSLGTASPGWHVALTGDFNADNTSDILWRNDNGAVGLWQLKGGQAIAATGLGTASPDWHIADTGDFNGDGNSDILWRNDNGVVSMWFLNGGSVIGTANFGVAGLDWHIAGTGDFDANGSSDILWRNDNGAVSIWKLNGGAVIGTASLGTAGADWHVADTGDVNRDGNSDILWRNDNGAASLWELHGGQVVATASLGTIGNDWHIVA
jgi:FG-GAP-like repeat